jgi:hypothetical protein
LRGSLPAGGADGLCRMSLAKLYSHNVPKG